MYTNYPAPPEPAVPFPPRPRPYPRSWWRRLLPWLTAITLLPFVAYPLGALLAGQFHCQISGDPPTGPPCYAHGVNIEPVASLLEDTGEGALLTIFLVPVVLVGWVAVLVLHIRSRRQLPATSMPPLPRHYGPGTGPQG